MGKIFHGGLDDPRSWSVPWTGPKLGHGAYGLAASKAIVASRVEASKQAPKKKGGGKVRNYGPAFEASDVPDNTFHDGVLAEMAVKAIGECAQQDKPFWLGVGFIRPHLPFVAPQKYWDLYDPAQIELAPNPFRPKGAPDYAVTAGGELRSYAGIPAGPIPDDLARQLKHGYYAAISYMDAQLGRVLDELERLGLRERTIVVLWGDHGYHLGENGIYTKMTNFELGTRVPLMISVPGQATAGQRTQALVELVDLYPTLAELCGLPLPKHLEGTSFAPLVADPARPWKPAAFSQYLRTGKPPYMGRSIRTDRWRYTEWTDPQGQPAGAELYDHESDPAETANLAGAASNRSIVEDLAARLHAGWRQSLPPQP
jgi:arylsulfatase A-like enzyme